MASKKGGEKSGGETLEIDREAYERLEEARGEDESFSEVIKRYIRKRQTPEEILRNMRRAAVSPATLRSIDESAARRRQAVHRTKE